MVKEGLMIKFLPELNQGLGRNLADKKKHIEKGRDCVKPSTHGRLPVLILGGS